MIQKLKLLYKKEVNDWIFSISTYIMLAIYLLISGYIITSYISLHANTNIEMILPDLTMLFVFFVPLLTISSIYKEDRNNSNVLIMCSPTSLQEVLLAKFLALLTVAEVALFSNVIQFLAIRIIDVISFRILILSLVGFSLLTVTLTSIGMLIAALVKNPYVAFVATYVVYMFLFVMNYFERYIPVFFKGIYAVFAIFLDISKYWIVGKVSLFSFIHALMICIICYIYALKFLEKRWRR